MLEFTAVALRSFLSADIVVGVPIRLGAKPVAANDIVKLAELAVICVSCLVSPRA